jgi:hypothetical protein
MSRGRHDETGGRVEPRSYVDREPVVTFHVEPFVVQAYQPAENEGSRPVLASETQELFVHGYGAQAVWGALGTHEVTDVYPAGGYAEPR